MGRTVNYFRLFGVVLVLSLFLAGCEQEHNSPGILNNSEASSDSDSCTALTAGAPTNSPDATSKSVEGGSDSLAFVVTHEFGQIMVVTQMFEVVPTNGWTSNILAVIVTNPIPYVLDDSIWSNYWQRLPSDQTGDSGTIQSGGAIMTAPYP